MSLVSPLAYAPDAKSHFITYISHSVPRITQRCFDFAQHDDTTDRIERSMQLAVSRQTKTPNLKPSDRYWVWVFGFLLITANRLLPTDPTTKTRTMSVFDVCLNMSLNRRRR